MVLASFDRRYLVRVRLADRPGALARVAGRVGAVRGDLIGIEILERVDGYVIDELLIELPAEGVLDVLIRELEEEDEVTVEETMAVRDLDVDPEAAALEVVSVLLGAEDGDEVLWTLCDHTRRLVRTDWACVIEAGGQIPARSGRLPSHERLRTTLASTEPGVQPVVAADDLDGDDLLWLPLPSLSAILVLGRSGGAWRAAEQRRVAALARVAATWHGRLRERARLRSQRDHPAGGGVPSAPPVAVPDDVSTLFDW